MRKSSIFTFKNMQILQDITVILKVDINPLSLSLKHCSQALYPSTRKRSYIHEVSFVIIIIIIVIIVIIISSSSSKVAVLQNEHIALHIGSLRMIKQSARHIVKCWGTTSQGSPQVFHPLPFPISLFSFPFHLLSSLSFHPQCGS